MLQRFLEELSGFQGRLRSRASINVNDRSTKSSAIDLATSYFNIHRTSLTEALGESSELFKHDEHWQDLVRLAHGNNQRRTYLKLLTTLVKELRELNVQTVSKTIDKGSNSGGQSDLTPPELQLVSTLEALLPTAAASYRQGILDLQAPARLSYRGTASEFREALRETLDHLAPDCEVEKQPGFKLEDGQKRPSMRQKVRFVLVSRGRSRTQTAVTEKSVGVVEDLSEDVVRAIYDRASLATHLETTRAEVMRIKRYVDTVLFDLLEVPETAPRRGTLQ